MENVITRWEVEGKRFNILSHTENGFWANHNKVAVDSWSNAVFYENPVTTLRECEVCGKRSTPKKVQYRYTLGFDYLCMGCWNKLRPLEARINEHREVNTLINKLNRERLKWLKSQTQDN